MSPKKIENKKGKYFYWITRVRGKKRYEKILLCKLDKNYGCLLANQDHCSFTSAMECRHGLIFKLPEYEEEAAKEAISFRELQRKPWNEIKQKMPINIRFKGEIVAQLVTPRDTE